MKRIDGNKIMVALLLLFSLAVMAKLCLNSNEYNFVDNRMSYRFRMPSLKDTLNGDFQKNFESIIADQMPKYNWFKLLYLKVENYVNVLSIKIFNMDKKGKYINLNGVNLFDDYLLYTPIVSSDLKTISSNDIEEINKIIANTDSNVYVYFVNSDYNIGFDKTKKVDVVSFLRSNLNLNEDKIGQLSIKSFNQYKKYFYKTDHHWNHVGSYRGYKDIAELMGIDKPILFNKEYCFDNADSYGSKSKKLAGIKILNERMCVYDFSLPNFKYYNGNEELDEYGSSIEELKQGDELSYAGIYGGDYPELIIRNTEIDSQKKLLIYSNSYSNAVNKLLAASYAETYIIDGRYYNEESMIEYINNHQIDDVLILGNCMLLWDDIKW